MARPTALTPEVETGTRPTDPESVRWIRSFLIMRLFVGLLGAALPLLLLISDHALLDGDPIPRDSLSAYYYSGARELFVGVLCATGVFLVTYKVAQRGLENTLSIIAGGAAILVALWPTGRPSNRLGLTPLQDRVGEDVVQGVHYVFAGVFIVFLGVITYYFGVREGDRPLRQGQKRSPEFWRRFHWGCAAAIGAAVLWILATWLVDGPRTALLWGEWVAVWAFAASWFAKGYERDVLRGHPAPEVGSAIRSPREG